MSHRGTRVELFEDRILLWSWSTPRLFRPPQLTSVVAIRVKKRVADQKSEALTERHTCSWYEDMFFSAAKSTEKKSYVTMGEVLSILPLPGETSTFTARVATLDLRHLWGRWLTALLSCRFWKRLFSLKLRRLLLSTLDSQLISDKQKQPNRLKTILVKAETPTLGSRGKKRKISKCMYYFKSFSKLRSL